MTAVQSGMPSALKVNIYRTFFRSGKPASNHWTFKRLLYMNYLMTCIKACTTGLIQCPRGVQWVTQTVDKLPVPSLLAYNMINFINMHKVLNSGLRKGQQHNSFSKCKFNFLSVKSGVSNDLPVHYILPSQWSFSYLRLWPCSVQGKQQYFP